MNIEAINTLFSIEQGKGYEGDVNGFAQQLQSDPTFLEYAYNTVIENGYEKTIDDFAELVGFKSEELKKKIRI